MRLWNVIGMAGALFAAVSCAPLDSSRTANDARGTLPVLKRANGSTVPIGTNGSGDRVTSSELRAIREKRIAAGERSSAIVGSSAGSSKGSWADFNPGNDSPDDDYPTSLPPLKIDYPYALPVPGRKGWVYAPETNRPVNVRGVASGKLVYDETDPANRNADGSLKPYAEMPHKFRVP